MSATEKVYFQFPTQLLAYGEDDASKRLHAILSWCIVDRARDIEEKHADDGLLETMFEKVADTDYPNGFNADNQTHVAIVAACGLLGVKGGSIQNQINQAGRVTTFINAMKAQYGAFPNVRIRRDLFWDCINGTLRYRVFSVMCALYAVLGDKAYYPITRSRIIAGAMGYKTPSMMTPKTLKARTDKAAPLTTKQLRLAVDELERRGLICRVQANRRQVFYSNRMDRETLEKRIIESRVKKATKVPLMRIADSSIRDKIEAAIKTALAIARGDAGATITGATITKANEGPDKGHSKGHSKGHHNRSSLIEASLIESEIKETRLLSPPRGGDVSVPIQKSGKPAQPFPDARIKELERLIAQAVAVNTPESLQDSKRFSEQLTKLRGEWV